MTRVIATMTMIMTAAFASLFVLAGTAAQTEIVCTSRGCWETGGRIFRNGGRMTPGAHYINRRDGEKDTVNPYE